MCESQLREQRHLAGGMHVPVQAGRSRREERGPTWNLFFWLWLLSLCAAACCTASWRTSTTGSDRGLPLHAVLLW